MTVIDRSALVPYPAEAMYRLVNDIEAYPQFMEGCVGATVLHSSDQEIEARLELAKGGMRYGFTTRNRLLPPNRIELSLVEGPFEHFSGHWSFQTLGVEASKVSLHLEFEMGGLLGVGARLLFNPIANHLVDALVRRANQLYGR